MHEPESVLENKDFKVLWYFCIQTHHLIDACRLDLVAVDKKNETRKIIDFAVPGDSKIRKRKYLARELQIIWKAKVKV